MSRANEPAVPTLEFYNENVTGTTAGLTIREHFAGLALDSVARELQDSHYTIEQIAREIGLAKTSDYKSEAHRERFLARRVCLRADALIAELAKP